MEKFIEGYVVTSLSISICSVFNLQRIEGVDIESEEVPEALSQALDTLRQYLVSDTGVELPSSDTALARAIGSEILVRMSLAPKAFAVMKDAAAVMVAVGADDRAMQVIFETLFNEVFVLNKKLRIFKCYCSIVTK